MAFFSATTSIPRSDCACASELSWRRRSATAVQVSAIFHGSRQAEASGSACETIPVPGGGAAEHKEARHGDLEEIFPRAALVGIGRAQTVFGTGFGRRRGGVGIAELRARKGPRSQQSVRQLGPPGFRLGQSRGVRLSGLHAGWPVASVSKCAECPLEGGSGSGRSRRGDSGVGQPRCSHRIMARA
jgi:hypothetical protein